MASSSFAEAAQVIAAYQGVTVDVTCTVAIVTLLSYDIVLNLGREYQYIWRSPMTWFPRVLYAWNRYAVLLCNILFLATIPPMSDTSCTVLYWFTLSTQILNLLGPAAFTTLRIYALSRQSRILSGLALVLSLGPFLVNATTAYQKPPVNLPAPVNCTAYSTTSTDIYIALTSISRGCLILADTLAVAVTWRQTRRAGSRIASTRRPSLGEVMWEKGNFYFCTLVSLNVADLVLVIASIAIQTEGGGPQASYVVLFVDPFSTILISRFLLALHETNARLEGAHTSTSISFNLTLNVDSDGGSRRGLPAFLEPLGGSVHSFRDDDEHVDSLEFARPSTQEERGSEPEAEDADAVATPVGSEAGGGGDSASLA